MASTNCRRSCFGFTLFLSNNQALAVAEVLNLDFGDETQGLTEEVDAGVLGISATVGLAHLLEAHDIASCIQ